MSDAQTIAEEVFESLRRHVLMARLSPAGGMTFAIMKLRQSYSVNRHRPLYVDIAHPEKGIDFVDEPSLSTLQIDNQTRAFGPGGEFHRWFNRAWIPSFYEEWDGYHKPRIAPLLGKDRPNDVKIGYFGDLRLLRHDIIHHKAVTEDAVRSKCVVLKWFDEGEEITLGHSHYAELFTLFPWEKLGAVPPPPPPPAPVDTRLPSTPLDALLRVRQNPGYFFG